MNQIFGVVSRTGAVRSLPVCERVAAHFGQAADAHLSTDGHALLGWVSDGGAIMGRASIDSCHLVYAGMFQRSLPDWPDSTSPLDAPDETAAYLLRRFLDRKDGFLDGLNGHFALAIIDTGTGKVTLATDPGGHRSIFLYHDEHVVCFCTNLSALNAVRVQPLERDRSYEDFLLGYEFLPDRRTPFSGAVRCAPGHVTRLRDGGAVQAIAPEVREASAASTREPTEHDVVELLYEVFMGALRDQCPSSERVAVMLGGFDSALIASALQRMGKKVETFTFSFREDGYSQRHVDTLRAYLGHAHTWVEITPPVIAEGLARYEVCFNQPVGQMHYLIQSAVACNAVRGREYLHCFTGDGCDELFLGYPTVHARAKLFQRLGVVPGWVVRMLQAILATRIVEDSLGHVARFLRNLLSISGRRMPVRGYISSRILDQWSLTRLRKGRNPPQAEDVEIVLNRLAKGLGGLTSTRLAFAGKSAVGLNKTKVEGCTAASGITLQSPFQHPRVVALVKALPESMLRPGDAATASGLGKHVLMRMAEIKGLLPREVIYQPKASPVTAPVDSWYAGELKETLVGAILEMGFEVDDAYVRELLRPRWAEEQFRRRVGLGRYTSHAASLLATYARLTRHAAKAAIR